ncbi:CoB--CoM heterodisulfide reductase iron-sulfur subunit A family protein [bacterium]|nr:MAG: CoB--CoM heterodisulfide reductase iron-sulfur subunit A family protein [bacterium]
MKEIKAENTAVVVGGGPAGMQASLALAARGHQVFLVDSAPSVGGLFPLLDNQFPTQSCGLCFMACDTPTYCPFLQCHLHENVETISSATVSSAERSGENWKLHLSCAPSRVNPEKCTDCGACEAVCPVEVKREFGEGLETRKAVYRYYPKAIAKGYAIDSENCTRCGKCVSACKSGAIDLDAPVSSRTIEGKAVILSFGAEIYPASGKGEFGYNRYPNVLSAVKFERMLAAGSPSLGLPVRPGDGKTPGSLAFIQCVGSRDPAYGRPHCYSVCCMFALKQALFVKERSPELTVTVYYMDIRAFGKDYEKYYTKAKELGIEFVRAIPSVIRHSPATGDLDIEVREGGKPVLRRHELVVLSAGFTQGEGAKKLAGVFGLTLSPNGYSCGEFTPCETGLPGLFVCGNLSGAKDIPDATQEGSLAAALAGELLNAPASEGLAAAPTPADWREEAPKIGVVLCECDGFNTSKVPFDVLAGEISVDPSVAFVERVSHACSKAGMSEVRSLFAEKEPNRLVLAACTERIVEDHYRHMFKTMGVHEGALEFSSLREAVMTGDPAAPLASVRSALKSSELTGFSGTVRESADKSVLVVGGGVAGLSAAHRLSSLGHPVYLVEKEEELGGLAVTSAYTVKGGDPKKFVEALIEKVNAAPNVKVYTGARITNAKGRIGAFRTTLETGDGEAELAHGGVVFATGAVPASPAVYGLGKNPKIITQKGMEKLLAGGCFRGGSVVMIQCAGSREEGEGKLPYCSRVCCTQALKNARKIKELSPDSQVTILYRDLRAYGDYELLYRKAREEGVLFTSFDPGNPPVVEAAENSIQVSWLEPSFGETLTEMPDYLVLSVGMVPAIEENLRLSSLYGVEIDDNGFFTEKNAKSATTDLTLPGLYVAGTAHAPKHIGEAVTQAGAASARLSALLSAGELTAPFNVSTVDERLCSRCGLCVETCPYGAREIDEEKKTAAVDAVLCKACGSCVTVCPNKAAKQFGYSPNQILSSLDEIL